MKLHHHILRALGRELRSVPRPLAYNYYAWLRPSLGPILAYLHLTKPDLFFIQVGAHDGQKWDPLHPFIEQFRLRGLLLEPQPEQFSALSKTYAHRPDLILVNAALAAHEGTIDLHRVRQDPRHPEWVTGAASVRADMVGETRDQFAKQGSSIETIEVRAVTPDTLRREFGVASFDVLQVDTEGFDYEVLKIFDFERTRPTVIHFEHNRLSKKDWEESLSKLIACGYLVTYSDMDTLAWHKDTSLSV